jgi:hypothetical protein
MENKRRPSYGTQKQQLESENVAVHGRRGGELTETMNVLFLLLLDENERYR